MALHAAGDLMQHLAEAAAEILLLDQAGDQIGLGVRHARLEQRRRILPDLAAQNVGRRVVLPNVAGCIFLAPRDCQELLGPAQIALGLALDRGHGAGQVIADARVEEARDRVVLDVLRRVTDPRQHPLEHADERKQQRAC